MRTFKLKSRYDCPCGGTFAVDLSTKIYGISPPRYNFVCDRCGARKTMSNDMEERVMLAVKTNESL